VKRRPDRPVGSGAWNATWPGRSEPPAYADLDRRLHLPRVALGLTAATRLDSWWVLSLLAELAEGLLLLCLESSELS
jgi:hypothetical protein